MKTFDCISNYLYNNSVRPTRQCDCAEVRNLCTSASRYHPCVNPQCQCNCNCNCSNPENKPFLSSYLEAMGSTQTIVSGQNVAFDISPDYIDIVGNAITVDTTGRIFTINRTGLYHIEWSVNLSSGTAPILLGLMENGDPASALRNLAVTGNYSSGALINVEAGSVPYTLSLHNFGGPIGIEDFPTIADTAASIRILRFADGASV